MACSSVGACLDDETISGTCHKNTSKWCWSNFLLSILRPKNKVKGKTATKLPSCSCRSIWVKRLPSGTWPSWAQPSWLWVKKSNPTNTLTLQPPPKQHGPPNLWWITDSNSAELGSGWSLQTRCLSDGVGPCFDSWAESAQVQQKTQLRMRDKKHHHSSWRSIDTITHRTGWTATAVPFSSFPTASRQRFADESRLPLDRTFRIWGFFGAFCYFGTCVSNCTDKTQDTPTLCNWVRYLAWSGDWAHNIQSGAHWYWISGLV